MPELLRIALTKQAGGGIRTFDVRISSEGTKNQRAHCYETDRSRSLDTGGENPDSNHGGVTIIQRRFSNVNTFDDDISPTLEPGAMSRVGGHIYDDSTGSLRANAGDNQQVVCYATQASGDRDNASQSFQEETAYTIPSNPMSDRGQAICVGIDLYNQTTTGEVTKTLNAVKSDSDHVPCVVNADRGGYEPTTASKASFFLNARNDGTADTLVATDFKDPQIVCYGLDRSSFNQGQNAQFDFSIDKEVSPPLVAKGPGAVFQKR